jgi:hypothetical protein
VATEGNSRKGGISSDIIREVGVQVFYNRDRKSDLQWSGHVQKWIE